MSYINNQTGKPIQETSILLEVGVPTGITGRTYLLNDSLRAAIRALQGKKVYMEMGTPKNGGQARADWASKVNDERVCGEASNIRLIESRQSPGLAVIIGDIKPHGPFGVVMRDTITGADQAHNHFSVRAACQLPDPENTDVLSIKHLYTFDLIARK